jgi:hypothetical protein
MTKDEALEVPLIELLKAVPKTARLIVDNLDGISSRSHPVGHLCHQAAEALEQPAWQGLTDDEALEIYCDVQENCIKDFPSELNTAWFKAVKDKNK